MFYFCYTGGFSGKQFLNTIEYFDAEANEWTTFAKQKQQLLEDGNGYYLEQESDANGDSSEHLVAINTETTNGDEKSFVLNGSFGGNIDIIKQHKGLDDKTKFDSDIIVDKNRINEDDNSAILPSIC